jgi:hypothetical protein
MPTIIGTDVVSSISRRHVVPTIVDQVYARNALFFRLNSANKKRIAGGTHVEVPNMYAELAAGGPYQGYDLLDVSPSDTVKNMGFDIKQHYVPVTVDGLTLAKCNTDLAVVNLLKMLWEQAAMQMADNLGDGVWSDGTNTKDIVGLKAAVDDGGVASTYAGLTRSSNTWLNCTDDSSTATLTLATLQTLFGNCASGGHTPTSIWSRQEQYNRFIALNVANQRFPTGTAGADQQLLSAGFTNALFNNVPWIIDDKCFDGPNTSNSAIVMLNEDYIELAIFADTDFYMVDFQRPINQDAMTGRLVWYGELMCLAPQTMGKLTNISA